MMHRAGHPGQSKCGPPSVPSFPAVCRGEDPDRRRGPVEKWSSGAESVNVGGGQSAAGPDDRLAPVVGPAEPWVAADPHTVRTEGPALASASRGESMDDQVAPPSAEVATAECPPT